MEFKKFSIVTVDEVISIVRRLIEDGNWKRDIQELHMHHTYIPNHSHFYSNLEKYGEDTYVMMQESMETSHKNRGFIARGDIVIDGDGSDWGYKTQYGVHITVFPNGLIGIGRDFNEIPCSISGHNSFGLATEIIGNFDTGNDIFKGEQMLTFIKLYAGLSQVLNLDIEDALVLHNEYSSKTCPGTSISKDLTVKRIQRYIDNYSLIKKDEEIENNTLTDSIFSDIIGIGFDLIDSTLTKDNEEESVEVKIEEIKEVNEIEEKGDDEVAFTLSKEKALWVQNSLLELGYELPKYGADGDYGNETIYAVKQFQIDYNVFPIDGLAGSITRLEIQNELDKLQVEEIEEMVKVDNESKYDHRVIGSTHIVTIYNPLDLKLHCEQTTGQKVNLKNIFNGSFVWWADSSKTKSYPTSLLVYDSTIINNYQPNGYSWQTSNPIANGAKCKTIIIYKDGSVKTEFRNNFTIEEAKNIHLAVSGLDIYPTVTKQGFVPYVGWSTVAYQTKRPTISYTKEGYIVLTYKPSSTADRANQTISYLNTNEDYNIVETVGVDGGGSGNFDVEGQNISRTSRYMYAFLTW